MSYRELERYIEKLKRNGHDVRRYMVDLDNKLSFPFINVIMVLAAFSVGLRYSKTKNVSRGIFSGICLGFSYWGFHSIALSFGYKEAFPPLFAAWLSNMLFFSIRHYRHSDGKDLNGKGTAFPGLHPERRFGWDEGVSRY